MTIRRIIRNHGNGSGGAGASLVGGVLTINGSGFGADPGAPIKHLTFSGVTDGASLLAANGFDFYHEDGTGNRLIVTADASQGIASGHKAFKHHISGSAPDTTDGSLTFSQCGFNLTSAAAESLFFSMYVKIIRLSGPAPSNFAQLKCGRYGFSNGQMTTPSATTCGNRLYQASATKYYPNHYDGSSWQNEEPDYRNHASSFSFFAETGSHVDWLDDAWHQHESYMALNTLSVADGKLRLKNDGQLRFSRDNVQPRDQSGDIIDFLIPCPGVTNGYTDGVGGTRSWDIFLSNIFASYTPKRVGLGNASTFSACTSVLPLSRTSWADTQIVAPVLGQPSGHNWAYVIDTDGVTNQGFAL